MESVSRQWCHVLERPHGQMFWFIKRFRMTKLHLKLESVILFPEIQWLSGKDIMKSNKCVSQKFSDWASFLNIDPQSLLMLTMPLSHPLSALSHGCHLSALLFPAQCSYLQSVHWHWDAPPFFTGQLETCMVQAFSSSSQRFPSASPHHSLQMWILLHHYRSVNMQI